MPQLLLLLLIATLSQTQAAPQQELFDSLFTIPDEINQLALEPFPYRGDKMYAVAAFAKVNWFTAQQICAYRGLTLASINSATEATGLQRFIAESGLDSQSFWLSGTNLAGDNWYWLSNGQPITRYANWGPGEPNNSGGGEHCLALLSNGRWNDISCEVSMYFVCENRCPLDSYNVPLLK